jgi:hypothetical protein
MADNDDGKGKDGKKKKSRKQGSKLPALFGPWIAMVAIGCVLVLGVVDLFYPHWAAATEEPTPRWLVTFLGCLGVFYWSSFACVPGRVAEERGRSAAWWFLVSIAFTPLISLLALALMPVGAPAEAATAPADGDDDEAGEEAA